jgi:hypothetical protein
MDNKKINSTYIYNQLGIQRPLPKKYDGFKVTDGSAKYDAKNNRFNIIKLGKSGFVEINCYTIIESEDNDDNL